MGEQEKLRLLAFEVTRRCRFNCRHCRAQANSAHEAEELTSEQCKRILKAVADFVGLPPKTTSAGHNDRGCVIILTGGEPMERGDIYELIAYGRDIGLRMVNATCGYPINDQTATKLKEAGLLAMSISLDGATVGTHDEFRRTPGAYDAAVGAAKTARKVGMRFQINTTITKSNVKEVPAIAKLAKELGAYCFNPFILVPTGRGKEIVDDLLEPAEYEKLLGELLQLKLSSPIEVRVTCGPQFARVYDQAMSRDQRGKVIDGICRRDERSSGLEQCTGSAGGEIHSKPDFSTRPDKSGLARNDIVNSLSEGRLNYQSSTINVPAGCMGGRGFGFISYRGDVQTCGFLDVSAGNLVENGYDFGKIWLGSQFLRDIRNYGAYKGKCGLCGYVTYCGGCRARAYAMTGDYMATDPVCAYRPMAEGDR